jgi:hypothetical protein
VKAGAPPELAVPLLSPTSRLVEIMPVPLRRSTDGGAPRLPTALRAGHRGGVLCVRFDGRDDGRVATLRRRDAPLWQEDVFEVYLAPPGAAGVYYEFEVNPLGALFDARVESPEGRRESMRVDVGWNCAGFSARVRTRPGLWSALLRIPLAPLGEEASPGWRANFYRVDRGEPDEYSAWSATFADPPDFHRPDRFGLLRFEETPAESSSPSTGE